jgi:hypothetical protein
MAMARNRIQFQKGLSEAGFAALYGSEESCREALRVGAGRRASSAPSAVGASTACLRTATSPNANHAGDRPR